MVAVRSLGLSLEQEERLVLAGPAPQADLASDSHSARQPPCLFHHHGDRETIPLSPSHVLFSSPHLKSQASDFGPVW